MDTSSDDKMIQNLITHRQKSLSIVRDCFGLDPNFAQAVSQAFEVFINKRENKPAEMMGECSTCLESCLGGLSIKALPSHCCDK